MRFVGMLSMTALILTGLPPVPIGPAPAEAQGRRMGYVQPRGDDPDARCAPFLRDARYEERDFSAGRGRGSRFGSVGNGYAPSPPPAPPPPIQYAPPSPADSSIAVTGSRMSE